jgi:hypothetical protein
MTSQGSRCSPQSHRYGRFLHVESSSMQIGIDIFFRSSKHANESRRSTASIKRSPASTSNQSPVSGPNSHHESASGKSYPQDSQSRTSGSSSKSQPPPSNPLPVISNENFNSQHYKVQTYATQVLSGTSSLGIDTPPYLQQALVDQHGSWSTREYSYSTIGGHLEFSVGPQCLDFGPTPPQDPWSSTYADDGYTNGDLAGIGAQFQC